MSWSSMYTLRIVSMISIRSCASLVSLPSTRSTANRCGPPLSSSTIRFRTSGEDASSIIRSHQSATAAMSPLCRFCNEIVIWETTHPRVRNLYGLLYASLVLVSAHSNMPGESAHPSTVAPMASSLRPTSFSFRASSCNHSSVTGRPNHPATMSCAATRATSGQ